MTCPKCNSDVIVVDVVQTPFNETYRRRRCKECKHVFYTVEYEVEYSGRFKEDWNEFCKLKRKQKED